jgi:bifunctional DNA-binding transcriptional regulator/antitoxin component of YhaV-PrlF toxin-antitoxin module
MRNTRISKKIDPIGRIILPIKLDKVYNTEPDNPLEV